MSLTVTITTDTTATDLDGNAHPLPASVYEVLKATWTLLLVEVPGRDGSLIVETANPAVDFQLAAFAVVVDSAVVPFKKVDLFTAEGVETDGSSFLPGESLAGELARLGYKTVGKARKHIGHCGCDEYDVTPI
jgi:hypothetical protein